TFDDYLLMLFFFFRCSGHDRGLHSFPTRRSSDLADGTLLVMVILLLCFIDPWLTLGAALLFGVVGSLTYRALASSLRSKGREEQIGRAHVSQYLSEPFRGDRDPAALLPTLLHLQVSRS